MGGLRACLHEGGGPQVGKVTCGGLPHLTCKRDHIKMRDYMDRWVTPPKRVTSPTWGPSPPCKHRPLNTGDFSTGQSTGHHDTDKQTALKVSPSSNLVKKYSIRSRVIFVVW